MFIVVFLVRKEMYFMLHIKVNYTFIHVLDGIIRIFDCSNFYFTLRSEISLPNYIWSILSLDIK